MPGEEALENIKPAENAEIVELLITIDMCGGNYQGALDRLSLKSEDVLPFQKIIVFANILHEKCQQAPSISSNFLNPSSLYIAKYFGRHLPALRTRVGF